MLFDSERPEWQPLINPVSNLVYSATGDSVRDVFVMGEQVVDGGQAHQDRRGEAAYGHTCDRGPFRKASQIGPHGAAQMAGGVIGIIRASPPAPPGGPTRRKLGTPATLVAALYAAGISPNLAEPPPRPYVVVGDAISASLTGVPGDPTRGKAITASRQTGLCLLCHSAPMPEEKFQGTIGPDLKGAGSRLTAGQVRLRIVDFEPGRSGTIMPSSTIGLTGWTGLPPRSAARRC